MTKVLPLSEYLFKQLAQLWTRLITSCVKNIMFSYQLGIDVGSVDCIAEFDGELSIIDFKTSKKPTREWIEDYFVQLFYAFMLYEMKGTSVKKFVIIMTCENGDVEV